MRDKENNAPEPADMAADRELKELLANWQAPPTPGSLLKRMDSSFRHEIGRPDLRTRKHLYWSLGLAAVAAIGTLIWLAAGRPGLRPANLDRHLIAISPDSGKRELGMQERSNAPRSTTNPATPGYVPMRQTRLRNTRTASSYLLTGVVRSEQGAPLPGAVVAIHQSGPDYSDPFMAPEWPPPAMSQSCDSQGRYTFVLEAPLHAFVTVRKPGFAANHGQIDIRGPEPVVKNHRLRPATASIEGYVYDNQGDPIPGAMIGINVGTHVALVRGSWISPIPAKTNALGYYRVADVPDGGVSMNAASSNHIKEYRDNIDTRPGELSRVDFHLKKAQLLSFLVRNAGGDTLAKPSGYCKGMDRQSMISYVRQGFLILGVEPRPGRFECTISAEGYKAKSVTANPESQPLEVVLDELEPHVISGRVITESGEPLPATVVEIYNLTAETDSDGRFSKILKIEEQSVQVRIIKPGYIEYKETASLSSGPAAKELEICLKQSEGGLYGRVLDAEGRPLERFLMVFKQTGLIFFRDFESEDGQFSVTDLPAGTYDLFIQSVPFGPLNSATVRNLQVKGVEIRKGYMYGELLFQFPPSK